MLRCTECYDIPEKTPDEPRSPSTIIPADDKLFIFYDSIFHDDDNNENTRVTELLVYEPKTAHFQEHGILLEESTDSVTVHNGQAYLWASGRTTLQPRKVYKLDLQTKDVDLFLETPPEIGIRRFHPGRAAWMGIFIDHDDDRRKEEIAIVADTMYVLKKRNDLVEISMDTKQIVTNYVLQNDNETPLIIPPLRKLLSKNGKLYLWANDNSCYQTLHLIENKKAILLWNSGKKARGYMDETYKWADDFVIHAWTKRETKRMSVSSYDFEENEWTRRRVEMKDGEKIVSFATINDTIYAIMKSRSGKYRLKVFELKPSLSDICMIKITDQLFYGHKGIEKSTEEWEKLSFPLRKKFADMMIWKLKEDVEI